MWVFDCRPKGRYTGPWWRCISTIRKAGNRCTLSCWSVSSCLLRHAMRLQEEPPGQTSWAVVDSFALRCWIIISQFWRPSYRWTSVSRYQNVSSLDFIRAKDDGGGGDNWSYKTYKAPVKSSPSTNQNPVFYRPDALPVAQPTVYKQCCWVIVIIIIIRAFTRHTLST